MMVVATKADCSAGYF